MNTREPSFFEGLRPTVRSPFSMRWRAEQQSQQQQQNRQEQWESHTALERGNPTRIYTAPAFKPKR